MLKVMKHEGAAVESDWIKNCRRQATHLHINTAPNLLSTYVGN